MVYPYPYKGIPRSKQEKCRTSMPLEKARIWLDFNEFCAVDPDSGAPIYLFSQADIVNDSDGNDVALYEGMTVSVFDEDLDGSDRPDALLADGILVRNDLEQYPMVKWLIRLTQHKRNDSDETDYIYHMSDLG